MTHDELLIEINRRLDIALYNGDAQSIHALRSVVEWHKSEEVTLPDGYWGIICSSCSNNGFYSLYPCHTIQIIEKELA